MKNVIYAGTNITRDINSGNIIPLDTVVRRFNRRNATTEVDLLGNAISIETKNCNNTRYNIIAKITFAGAVGNGEISIYQDGVLIPLAIATASITTADTQFITVTIPASILVKGCGLSAITLVNTGAIALTITNASILVIED